MNQRDKVADGFRTGEETAAVITLGLIVIWGLFGPWVWWLNFLAGLIPFAVFNHFLAEAIGSLIAGSTDAR